MTTKWMVIYPNGNKNVLSIAEVKDYERDEWSLASLKEYDEEKDAAIHARKLSDKHSIPLSRSPNNSRLLHVLDLDETEEI